MNVKQLHIAGGIDRYESADGSREWTQNNKIDNLIFIYINNLFYFDIFFYLNKSFEIVEIKINFNFVIKQFKFRICEILIYHR